MMKNTQSFLRLVLFTTALAMLLTLSTGCGLFDSDDISPETAPTSPSQTVTPETSTPAPPKGPQMDLRIKGYLFNDKHENVDTALLTAQGPLSFSFDDGNTGSTYLSVSGFSDYSHNDSSFFANEQKNHILVISVQSYQNRRNPETGKSYIFTEVIYTMYIDQTTSQFLMCDIRDYHSGTEQQYYFTASANPKIISDTLTKAYIG